MRTSPPEIHETEIKRKRVLWLSHLLPWPPKGGVLQRSYYLMRGVGKRHDLQVIAFRQRAHQPDALRQEEAIGALSEIATVRGVFDLPGDRSTGGTVGLALRSLLPGPPYTIRWGSCPHYRRAVQSAVEEFQPEVVHLDTVSLCPYLDVIRGIPSLLNHHNIESHMLLRRVENEPNLAKRFYYWQEGHRLAAYEQRVARRLSAHLVCADLDAERLRARVGDVRTKVVPNGVDLDYFRPTPPSTPTRPGSLIFVGRMSWYPNASAMRFFLRDVWPKLVRRRPDASLRIVGSHPPQDLMALSEEDGRVEIMGFVDEMRPLVHQASVYVCPIFDGGGTKLKMLDAMAMGKAIVAHPVACEGLHLQHGEQVLMAESGEEFLSCIEGLFEDETLREHLGKRARQHVEAHFSFETIGRDLSEFLERIASHGRGDHPS